MGRDGSAGKVGEQKKMTESVKVGKGLEMECEEWRKSGSGGRV